MTDEELEQIRSEIAELKKRLPLPWILWQGRKEEFRQNPEQKQPVMAGAVLKHADGTVVPIPPGSQIVTQPKATKNPARWDIYTGPGVDETTKIMDLKAKGAKQVAHFHPESPTIYDQSDESDYSMPFLTKSLDRLDRMLQLIEELKSSRRKGIWPF